MNRIIPVILFFLLIAFVFDMVRYGRSISNDQKSTHETISSYSTKWKLERPKHIKKGHQIKGFKAKDLKNETFLLLDQSLICPNDSFYNIKFFKPSKMSSVGKDFIVMVKHKEKYQYYYMLSQLKPGNYKMYFTDALNQSTAYIVNVYRSRVKNLSQKEFMVSVYKYKKEPTLKHSLYEYIKNNLVQNIPSNIEIIFETRDKDCLKERIYTSFQKTKTSVTFSEMVDNQPLDFFQSYSKDLFLPYKRFETTVATKKRSSFFNSCPQERLTIKVDDYYLIYENSSCKFSIYDELQQLKKEWGFVKKL